LLDNIRLTIDVAGATAADNTLAYGFSEVKGMAAVMALKGNTETGILALAQGYGSQTGAAVDINRADIVTGNPLSVDDEKVYGDGDLKIHFGFTDAWQKGGGFLAYANGVGDSALGVDSNDTSLDDLTFGAAVAIASNAVDFEFNIGQIALADSTYATAAGRLGTEVIQKTDHLTGLDQDAGTDTTTTLISDLSMKGYLGPMDIHIENNGNGFGAGVGRGAADSKIHWDSFFKVTDLDLYIDIAGVQLTDIKIHNVRGDVSSLDGTSSFGFAHSKRDIFAVKDAVLHLEDPRVLVDGIAINTRFKGDIDIGALSFGNTGTSIGQIYITDITSTTNWTISAH
jgi:hypothetical protein